MIEALNIMEGYDMRSTPLNSADYIHRADEALKLAYADRDTYYGDPKFIAYSRRMCCFRRNTPRSAAS